MKRTALILPFLLLSGCAIHRHDPGFGRVYMRQYSNWTPNRIDRFPR